jgi:hypothetical protein
MLRKPSSLPFLALLLGVILLAAQLHFCVDMTGSPSGSHICPVCSVASSVVTAQSPSVEIIRVSDRLEIAPSLVALSSAVPRGTSPRAPPAF